MVVLNMLILILISSVFSTSAIGKYSSKSLEGYPSGYLGECPGSNKKAIITTKSLKKISFIVQGEGPPFSANRTKYHYFQMRELAKDPKLDFKNKKTLVYCPGYLESPNFFLARIVGAAYKKLNYNVLAIDAHYFLTMNYPVTVRLMRPLGKRVAEMLAVLSEEGLNPEDIEVIGLSLGGQTISYIAKNYRQITGKNIASLTALEPAGPCFRTIGPEDRLDSSDADFVQVIHTNIDGYGNAAAVGHVDFYVNGAEYQPGESDVIPCGSLCSHIKSYLIWLSALQNPDQFIAMKCDSIQEIRENKCYGKTPLITNVVGLKVDKEKQGMFYLTTNNLWPYYLGENGLKEESNYVKRTLSNMNKIDVLKV